MVVFIDDEYLQHYGILRRSGRYPWGSGGNPEQDARSFNALLDDLRNGDTPMTDPQIAEALGIKTTQLRDAISIATEEIRSANISMATSLSREKQMSNRAIADRMLGDPKKESTIRGWLEGADKIRDNSLETIANVLRGHLGTSRWLDVGIGTQLHMNISTTRLRASIAKLKDEGYKTWSVQLPQLGTDNLTKYKILGHPDSTWTEAKDALLAGEVRIVNDRTEDGGLSFMTPKEDPVSISSKRIQVRYGPDGGSQMDGVIELRRGIPDLSLGANRYAQVRVAVDGTHYLKGMAIYADDLPPGTDIRYNSNKPPGTPVKGDKSNTVLKPLDLKPEAAGNRFGAITRPIVYTDSDGNEITSALNRVNEEGDWDKWSDSLSSQLLSKQSIKLAATQLDKARKIRQEDFDKIMTLTNPVVKKRLLLDLAGAADSDAVNLQAAAIKGQANRVILPMNSMRPNEVYAPSFDNGQRVALVRHPHGGPFEIPQLTVNNNNVTAKRLMGNASDAIGIHHSVAAQLSGADFDGDSVLVIPNDSGRIKSKPPLEQLQDFDAKEVYHEVPGMTVMTKENTQKEMGKISNLITDMTIKGAPTNEIAAAVKHSMVVIDAEKHVLNYKQSEIDNGIKQLKRTYQSPNRGASTIISRARAEAKIPQVRAARQAEGGPINPETGELNTVPTNRTYVNKAGETVVKLTKTTKGALAKDAFTLSSGEPIENVYAGYANNMKAMANAARKEAVSISNPPYSPAAKAFYAKEVSSLTAKLKVALMNAPLERRAQAIGNATYQAKLDATPDMTPDQQKKARYQSLNDARELTGASKIRIGSDDSPLTQQEWYAIQSGAVSATTLTSILDNANMDRVRDLATPSNRSSLTTGQIALAKSMSNSGRSLSEIASALGIPKSTIADNLAKA